MGSVVENYVDVQASDVEESEEVAQRSSGLWEKYEKCKICGVKYPHGEMVLFRGAWYCHEFGCADDIRGIILNEQSDQERRRPDNDNRSRYY